MPEVFLVRIVFNACGRNETVVQKAAPKPIVVIKIVFTAK